MNQVDEPRLYGRCRDERGRESEGDEIFIYVAMGSGDYIKNVSQANYRMCAFSLTSSSRFRMPVKQVITPRME